MKNTMTAYDFVNQWPESREDQFSRAGLFAIYDYLTELEEDLGEEFEFDPIAICCEWTEYEMPSEACVDYGLTTDRNNIETLREHTQVIEFYGGIIIQQF